MKKILILGSRNSGEKNDARIIAERVGSDDSLDAKLVYWEDLVFVVSTGRVEVWFADEKFLPADIALVIAVGWYKSGKQLIYRDIAFSFALLLKEYGVPFWNSEMVQQRSISKLSTMVQLALAGIAVPSTVASLTLDYAVGRMKKYPYIAKAASASRGESNYLVASADDEVQLRKDEVQLFLLQDYLENDHDLRVICFGGEPSLVLRRSRGEGATTHLNNTSQGGAAGWIDVHEVSTQILTYCQKISKITGRELAGIDLIPDAGSPIGYSCLEVNAIPQLTSGTDVDRKMKALVHTLRQMKEG